MTGGTRNGGSCADQSAQRSTQCGVLVIDKPEGMTSFRVVDRVKKRLGLKKAGHCGTLDPFATGVLIVCLNQATAITELFSSQEKVYLAVIRLGVETDTLDRTGEVTRTWDGPAPSEEEVRKALAGFLGSSTQEVPRYSAVKIQGRRLYKLTRSGVEVDVPSREIRIHGIELRAYGWPDVTVEVRCSKGTYVRQLAADIGSLLGCGAHLGELRRTASGQFRIDQAVPLDRLLDASGDEAPVDWRKKLISVNDALAHLPSVVVEDETLLRRLSNGYLDPGWEAHNRERFARQGNPVRIVSGGNQLLALWWPQPEAGKRRRLRPFDREASLDIKQSISRKTKED